MTKREQELLRSEVGDSGVAPRLCVRSQTRIDAGQWFRRKPVWLCVLEDELIMLAEARRRYVDRVPISQCFGSHYNHETGELVVAPGEGLQFCRFAVTPRDALRILQLLDIAA